MIIGKIYIILINLLYTTQYRIKANLKSFIISLYFLFWDNLSYILYFIFHSSFSKHLIKLIRENLNLHLSFIEFYYFLWFCESIVINIIPHF